MSMAFGLEIVKFACHLLEDKKVGSFHLPVFSFQFAVGSRFGDNLKSVFS